MIVTALAILEEREREANKKNPRHYDERNTPGPGGPMQLSG